MHGDSFVCIQHISAIPFPIPRLLLLPFLSPNTEIVLIYVCYLLRNLPFKTEMLASVCFRWG